MPHKRRSHGHHKNTKEAKEVSLCLLFQSLRNFSISKKTHFHASLEWLWHYAGWLHWIYFKAISSISSQHRLVLSITLHHRSIDQSSAAGWKTPPARFENSQTIVVYQIPSLEMCVWWWECGGGTHLSWHTNARTDTHTFHLGCMPVLDSLWLWGRARRTGKKNNNLRLSNSEPEGD